MSKEGVKIILSSPDVMSFQLSTIIMGLNSSDLDLLAKT